MTVSEKQLSSFMLVLVFAAVLVYSVPAVIRAITIIAAFVWMVIRNFRAVRITKLNKCHLLWAVLFFLLVKISALWAAYPEAVAEVENNVIWAILVSLITAEYVITYDAGPEDIAGLFLPVVVVFAVNLLLHFSISSSGRISASMNENGFAMISCGMLLFILYGFKKASGTLKAVYLLVSLFLVVCSLLSGSKKGFIELVVIILLICFYEKNNKSALKRLTAGIIGIAAVFFLLYLCMKVDILYNSIGQRIEAFANVFFYADTSDSSTIRRYNMINTAWKLFGRRVLYGYGINNFKYLTRFGTYSHCGYMEILTGTGIIGFLVYYPVYIKALADSFAQWKNQTEGAIVPLACFVCFFIVEFASVGYFSSYTALYLGLCIGLLQTMKNRNSLRPD